MISEKSIRSLQKNVTGMDRHTDLIALRSIAAEERLIRILHVEVRLDLACSRTTDLARNFAVIIVAFATAFATDDAIP